MKKDGKLRGLLLILIFLLSWRSVQAEEQRGAPSPANLPTVERLEYLSVFANGARITVEEGSQPHLSRVGYMQGGEKVYLNLDPGSIVPVYEADMSRMNVYGGSFGRKVKETFIEVEGGRLHGVYGGGYGRGSEAERTQMTITGGEIDQVKGGGHSYSKVSGSTEIYLLGGKIGDLFGGGESESPVDGDTNITIEIDKDVRIGRIFGGGERNSILSGSSKIKIFGGSCREVYGGGDLRSAVKGTSFIKVYKGTVDLVQGGGSGNSEVESTDIFVRDSAVVDTVYGSSRNARVRGKKHGVILNPDTKTEGFDHLLFGRRGSDGQPEYLTKGEVSGSFRLWEMPREAKLYVTKNSSLSLPDMHQIEAAGQLKVNGSLRVEGSLSLESSGQLTASRTGRIEMIGRGKIFIKTGGSLIVDPGGIFDMRSGSYFPLNIDYGGELRVLDGGKFYLGKETEIFCQRGAKVSGSLATPVHELSDRQQGYILIEDLIYTGEDLQKKVVPNLWGLEIDLAKYQRKFEYLKGDRWEETREVRNPGEYRVNFKRGETTLSKKFKVLGSAPPLPQYKIKVTPENGWEFEDVPIGEPLFSKKITVENLGNTKVYLGVSLEGDTEAFYCMTPPGRLGLEPRETKAFELWAVKLERAGTYRATLLIANEGEIQERYPLQLAVRPLNEIYSMEMKPEGSWDFGEAEVGYENIETDLLLKNTGKRDIENLRRIFECEPEGSFESSVPESIATLERGVTYDLYLRPKKGLPPGVYRGRFQLTDDKVISKSVELKFTVKEKAGPPNPPSPPSPPPTPPNLPDPPISPPDLPIESPYREWEAKREVPLDKEWTVRFNRSIDERGLTGENVFILRADQTGTKIETELKLAEDGRSIQIRPLAPYQRGTKYFLIIQKIKAEDEKLLKENILMLFETVQ